MHRRTYYPFFVLLIFISFFTPHPGTLHSQQVQTLDLAEFILADADYRFGEQVIFRLQLRSDEGITKAVVTFKEAVGNTTGLASVDVTQLSNDVYLLVSAVDLDGFPLRPFTTVNFRFDADLENGTIVQSPDFSFYYADDRFEWQTAETGKLRLHWYDRDSAFGDTAMAISNEGLERVQSILNAKAQESIDIYIYNKLEDFNSIMLSDRGELTAGFAEPELNQVLVHLPTGPEQQLFIQQRIPHELMHVMLSTIAGGNPGSIPTWLEEGLASIAEIYPNPDYARILEDAAAKDEFLPMQLLCTSFPEKITHTFLAYAQSESFTRFLTHRFHTDGIRNLVSVYASGAGCEEGIEIAFGLPLYQLEAQWRSGSVENNSLISFTNEFSPWLVLLVTILIAPLLAVLFSKRRKRTSGMEQHEREG